MEQEQVLAQAREVSLTMEAILRGCTMLRADSGLRLLCTKKFHQGKLAEMKEQLEDAFGEVEVYHSTEVYIQEAMQDPLVKYAVENLGAIVAVED